MGVKPEDMKCACTKYLEIEQTLKKNHLKDITTATAKIRKNLKSWNFIENDENKESNEQKSMVDENESEEDSCCTCDLYFQRLVNFRCDIG